MIQKFYTKLSEKEKKMFYFSAGAVILALFDLLFLRPVTSKLKMIDDEIFDKENNIKRDLRLLSYTDRILAEREAFSPYYNTEVLTPDQIKATFLQKIEMLATEAKINLVKLAPAGEEKKKGFVKYLADLDCTGALDDIVKFMHLIDSTQELLKITKVNIVSKQSAKEVSATMTVVKIIFDPRAVWTEQELAQRASNQRLGQGTVGVGSSSGIGGGSGGPGVGTATIGPGGTSGQMGPGGGGSGERSSGSTTSTADAGSGTAAGVGGRATGKNIVGTGGGGGGTGGGGGGGSGVDGGSTGRTGSEAGGGSGVAGGDGAGGGGGEGIGKGGGPPGGAGTGGGGGSGVDGGSAGRTGSGSGGGSKVTGGSPGGTGGGGTVDQGNGLSIGQERSTSGTTTGKHFSVGRQIGSGQQATVVAEDTGSKKSSGGRARVSNLFDLWNNFWGIKPKEKESAPSEEQDINWEEVEEDQNKPNLWEKLMQKNQ